MIRTRTTRSTPKGVRSVSAAVGTSLLHPARAAVETLEARWLLSSEPTTLVTFNRTDGDTPAAGLTLSGSTLYGTTEVGGASGCGTVFSVPLAGGSPTTLATFNAANGAYPDAGLTLSGSTLYGTTLEGGTSGRGTVFSVPRGGGTPTVVASFNGIDGNGPSGGLVVSAVSGDTRLYGTTKFGGTDGTAYGYGTVFSVTISGGPAASIALTGPSNQSATAAKSASVSLGSFTESGATGPFKDDVDWGDGSADTIVSLSAAGTIPATAHTFAKAGSFTVSETITDADGNTSNAVTFTETVAAATNTAKITVTAPAAQTATVGTSKSFTLGSFTETGATGPYSVDVNWGDGSADSKFTLSAAGTIPATAHTYAKAATDTVTVTVTDSKGDATGKATFAVNVTAPVNKLVFSKQPANITAGKAISPAVVIDVENSLGQIVTTDDSTVTLAIEYGQASVVQKTVTAKAVKGIASFGSIILSLAGSYKLKVTDGSLTSATSSSFAVAAAAAAKLVFLQSPVSSKVGKAITPAVTIEVEDTFGNLVTTDKSTVKIAIDTGPTGGTLTGTVSVAAVAGVAKFSNLLLSKAGSYKLKATDGSLVDVLSGVFTVA